MARWVGSVFGSFLGLGSADALVVELQDVGVMYETIDSGVNYGAGYLFLQ